MSMSRTIGWVLLIAAVGAAGYYGWQRYQRRAYDQPPPRRSRRGRRRPAVPVKTAPVEKADFPVYLTGLGIDAGI